MLIDFGGEKECFLCGSRVNQAYIQQCGECSMSVHSYCMPRSSLDNALGLSSPSAEERKEGTEEISSPPKPSWHTELTESNQVISLLCFLSVSLCLSVCLSVTCLISSASSLLSSSLLSYPILSYPILSYPILSYPSSLLSTLSSLLSFSLILSFTKASASLFGIASPPTKKSHRESSRADKVEKGEGREDEIQKDEETKENSVEEFTVGIEREKKEAAIKRERELWKCWRCMRCEGCGCSFWETPLRRVDLHRVDKHINVGTCKNLCGLCLQR